MFIISYLTGRAAVAIVHMLVTEDRDQAKEQIVKERQLEAFRAVMQHGNITRAGEAIRLSQPAVTRYIADLEREVGFNLFIRRKEGSLPTPEAYAFYEEVQHSFAGLERLSQAAREIRELRRGHIKIATLPAAAFELAPSITTAFLQVHSDIKITLDVHTCERIADLVAGRQVHLGIAQLNSNPPGIDILNSYRSECVCVLPTDSPLVRHKIIKPKHLQEASTILLAQHTISSRHIDVAFLAENVQPNVLIECQPSYVACCLAAQGAGAAIVDPLTAEFFSRHAIEIRPFKPAIPFDFHLIRPTRESPSLAVRQFLDTVVDHMDKHDKLRALG